MAIEKIYFYMHRTNQRTHMRGGDGGTRVGQETESKGSCGQWPLLWSPGKEGEERQGKLSYRIARLMQ